MTPAAPQLELDFALGHSRPWLRVAEVANALRVSEDHVTNLFDSSALDVVLDLKSEGASRPCYRILRESFARFQMGNTNAAATDLEASLDPYLRTKPAVLLSHQIASHLAISHDLMLDHAAAFFDASAPRASKTFFRATRRQLLQFIHHRRLS